MSVVVNVDEDDDVSYVSPALICDVRSLGYISQNTVKKLISGPGDVSSELRPPRSSRRESHLHPVHLLQCKLNSRD